MYLIDIHPLYLLIHSPQMENIEIVLSVHQSLSMAFTLPRALPRYKGFHQFKTLQIPQNKLV